MKSLGPKYGCDAHDAMAAGDVVLSLSRAQPNVTMYRSERLTGDTRHIAALGVIVSLHSLQMPLVLAPAC